MTLADKIIVLRDGVTMQAGTVDEVFNKPASVFVARFVGVENILAGRVEKTSDAFATVMVGAQSLRATAPTIALKPEVQVGIRAEAVAVYPAGGARAATPAVNRFSARVTGVRVIGPLATVQVDCGFPLKAYVLAQQARAMELAPGRTVEVEIPAAAVHLTKD